jgi:hypothetical protein
MSAYSVHCTRPERHARVGDGLPLETKSAVTPIGQRVKAVTEHLVLDRLYCMRIIYTPLLSDLRGRRHDFAATLQL